MQKFIDPRKSQFKLLRSTSLTSSANNRKSIKSASAHRQKTISTHDLLENKFYNTFNQNFQNSNHKRKGSSGSQVFSQKAQTSNSNQKVNFVKVKLNRNNYQHKTTTETIDSNKPFSTSYSNSFQKRDPIMKVNFFKYRGYYDQHRNVINHTEGVESNINPSNTHSEFFTAQQNNQLFQNSPQRTEQSHENKSNHKSNYYNKTEISQFDQSCCQSQTKTLNDLQQEIKSLRESKLKEFQESINQKYKIYKSMNKKYFEHLAGKCKCYTCKCGKCCCEYIRHKPNSNIFIGSIQQTNYQEQFQNKSMKRQYSLKYVPQNQLLSNDTQLFLNTENQQTFSQPKGACQGAPRFSDQKKKRTRSFFNSDYDNKNTVYQDLLCRINPELNKNQQNLNRQEDNYNKNKLIQMKLAVQSPIKSKGGTNYKNQFKKYKNQIQLMQDNLNQFSKNKVYNQSSHIIKNPMNTYVHYLVNNQQAQKLNEYLNKYNSFNPNKNISPTLSPTTKSLYKTQSKRVHGQLQVEKCPHKIKQ